ERRGAGEGAERVGLVRPVEVAGAAGVTAQVVLRRLVIRQGHAGPGISHGCPPFTAHCPLGQIPSPPVNCNSTSRRKRVFSSARAFGAESGSAAPAGWWWRRRVARTRAARGGRWWIG